VPDRVAVFDNDGTLWCEKPMPIELGFILVRLAEMAEKDASLRDRQPWKAACERDFAWLGAVITKHYHGDDSDVKAAWSSTAASQRLPRQRVGGRPHPAFRADRGGTDGPHPARAHWTV
jgi:hypothetical protein